MKKKKSKRKRENTDKQAEVMREVRSKTDGAEGEMGISNSR